MRRIKASIDHWSNWLSLLLRETKINFMYCPVHGKTCQLTGCSKTYRICNQLENSAYPEIGKLDNFVGPQTIQGLEARIRTLELAQLKAENTKFAQSLNVARSYKLY